ncbi:MAG: hypothetical protein JNJ91_08685 [Flavobacteriales bacterium]|nr:hypothetical protein [Flavobacteriales bacterium]
MTVTIAPSVHSTFVRTTIHLLALLVPAADLLACTAFTVSRGGHTYIGCNEDAWSINAQVRFVHGGPGEYGAIYFDHFNGHPLRQQGPQLGMNEAGLVFDGLTIQPQQATAVPGRKPVHFDDLMPMLMRTCATVQEAASRLRTYDFSWLTRSMLFFADRHGDYLIVENDTMIMGHDTAYAIGNWRMGTCSDPATIPIPRLQAGRELLLSGNGASFEQAENVLSTMTVCRAKMGEGTLFSVLFDPQEAEAHLYFYHDFSQRVTFDLKEELAKGDRTLEMASLFGTRPEYERLKHYLTPFHQRWLFWALVALGGCAVLAGLVSLIGLVKAIIRPPADIRFAWLPALITGLSAMIVLVLAGVLLFNESVFYFGLNDAAGWLVLLPWVLLVLAPCLALVHRGSSRRRPVFRLAWLSLMGLFLGSLFYWGMFTG